MPGQLESRPRPVRCASRTSVWRGCGCGDADSAYAGSVHGGGSGIPEGSDDQGLTTETETALTTRIPLSSRHQRKRSPRTALRFGSWAATSRGYDGNATLPAAMPLRSPPRSAYAAPSSKSGESTQQGESGLTHCPIRPFAPLQVRTKDLTADIFYGRSARLVGIADCFPLLALFPQLFLGPFAPIMYRCHPGPFNKSSIKG